MASEVLALVGIDLRIKSMLQAATGGYGDTFNESEDYAWGFSRITWDRVCDESTTGRP
jgi:hypothetical protein